MADQKLEALWRDLVSELLQLSERPNSSVPTLTHQQRAYLQLVSPVVLVDGYVLLSAPHAAAKTVIEESLAPHITALLHSRLGTPFALAVSIAAPAEQAPAAPAAPAAEAKDWLSTQSPLERSAAVSSPYPQVGEQIPMGLDELAQLHAGQGRAQGASTSNQSPTPRSRSASTARSPRTTRTARRA